MKHRRLTLEDRYQISAYLKSPIGVREIARRLKVNPSTISREVRKLGKDYSPVEAQKMSEQRNLKRRFGKYKVSGETEVYVREKLKLDWSPDQICELFKQQTKKSLSYQTIYRYIARDKANGGELCQHLRILRKQRKDRKVPGWKAGWSNIPERKDISERPAIVEERSRLGDIERDLVIGKVNGPVLLTLVDRKSRFTKIVLIEKKDADEVHWATIDALKDQKIRTITNDNGSEFAKHYFTSKDLGCEIYFSTPYHAWERGSNENTNGLIRQYFPKKTSLVGVTPERVKEVENLLNTRPRKCLSYKTPSEVHSEG